MKKDLLNWSIWKLYMQIKQEPLKYFHIDKNRNILKWNFKNYVIYCEHLPIQSQQ